MHPKTKRPIEIDDLYNFKLISEPAISPDGDRLTWVVTTIDNNDDTYKAALWISDIDGGNARQLTSGAHRDTAPVWSPDGNTIAFTSNRPAEIADTKNGEKTPPQLWIISPDGGEARQLTSHPGGASSPSWSPDSRRIAFVGNDAPTDEDGFTLPSTTGPHSDERVVHDIRYRFDGKGWLSTFSHIWTIELASREAKQLTVGDYNDNSPAWSPDGRLIAFSGNRRDDRRERVASSIHVIPAQGGDVRTIAPDDAMFSSPAWSPDGTRLAFLGHEDAESRSAHNQQVWTVKPDGSKLTNHTRKIDTTFADTGMSDLGTGGKTDPLWVDDKTLLVSGSQEGATRIFLLSTSNNSADPITSASQRVTQFAVTPNGKKLVYIAGDIDQPFRLVSSTLKGKRETVLADPNAEFVDKVELAAPIELDVKAPDGGKVQTWLLPPHGLDPDKGVKYPLIVQIHGGPHGMYGRAIFHEMQAMAGLGYGVLFCNPRGSTGYGQEFTGNTRGTWGESDMPDVIAAVEEACKLEWVDVGRLGITGGSYGGYLTNWIISHDTRFKAAVTQRCVSNFHSFVGTSDIGFDFGIYEFDGTPWGDAEKLLRYSPISYVDKIETPLLILHSEHDWRCPIEQSEQMFTALKYLGKEVGFVRIPDEGHELSRSGTPSRRIARLRHLIGWFDSHL